MFKGIIPCKDADKSELRWRDHGQFSTWHGCGSNKVKWLLKATVYIQSECISTETSCLILKKPEIQWKRRANLCQKGMPQSTRSSCLESSDSDLPGAFHYCCRQLHTKHERESSSCSFLRTWYPSENNIIFVRKTLCRKHNKILHWNHLCSRTTCASFLQIEKFPNNHQKQRLLWAEEVKASDVKDSHIVNDSSQICININHI